MEEIYKIKSKRNMEEIQMQHFLTTVERQRAQYQFFDIQKELMKTELLYITAKPELELCLIREIALADIINPCHLLILFIKWKRRELYVKEKNNNLLKFFVILDKLPIELQMKICNLCFCNQKEFIDKSLIEQELMTFN
jgi:hypothetical protein